MKITTLRVFTTIIAALAFSHYTNAQTALDKLLNVKYEYGYAVLTKGDTIQGKFEFNNSPQNYVLLVELNDSTGKKKAYDPNDIQFFYLANNWFKPKEIEGKKYFVQILYNDSLSLYLHRNYYITNEANRFNSYFLLEKADGNRLLVKPNWNFPFKSRMTSFFSECQPLVKKINDNKLGFKDMVQIAREYNEWLHNKKQ